MSDRSASSSFIHKYLPAQRDTPVFLLLHGTGGNEDDLIPFAKEISRDSSILSVRGKVLENGMPRFFRRFAEGVFDIEDLKFRTNELADFIEESSDKYNFELNQVVAIGYSNGANIGASLLILRPEVLTGVILFRGTLPLETSSLPDLRGKHVLISGGEFDEIIPQEGTMKLAEVLERAGAQVDLKWQKSNHGLVTADLLAAKSWAKKNLRTNQDSG